MNVWLVKQEPSAYSWEDFVRDRRTAWTGVRNFQARNNLSAMALGDRVLFYHSVTGKAIVGEAEVVKTAYPDPTAPEGNWVCVDLKPLKPFKSPVTLEDIKAHPGFRDFPLIRQSRLSVLPVSAAEYRTLLSLAKKGA